MLYWWERTKCKQANNCIHECRTIRDAGLNRTTDRKICLTRSEQIIIIIIIIIIKIPMIIIIITIIMITTRTTIMIIIIITITISIIYLKS